MKKLILVVAVFFGILTSGCIDKGVEVLPLDPVQFNREVEQLVPSNYLSQLDSVNFPIYRGQTPPNVVGVYLADSLLLRASNLMSDYSILDLWDPGYSLYKFSKQNTEYNIITMETKGKSKPNPYIPYSEAVGHGVGGSIAGTGQNFTICLTYDQKSKVTDATSPNYGASAMCRVTLLISGTKHNNGIANFCFAFIMLQKDDPNNILVPVGTIRVFQEMDAMASNSVWDFFDVSGVPAKVSGDLFMYNVEGGK